jgi:hypothetical protein
MNVETLHQSGLVRLTSQARPISLKTNRLIGLVKPSSDYAKSLHNLS